MTISPELPQLIRSVSNIDDTPQDISFFSDTSASDPLNSQFPEPISHMSITNLTILLINLLFSIPLPIKQPTTS